MDARRAECAMHIAFVAGAASPLRAMLLMVPVNGTGAASAHTDKEDRLRVSRTLLLSAQCSALGTRTPCSLAQGV